MVVHTVGGVASRKFCGAAVGSAVGVEREVAGELRVNAADVESEH